jgi:aspartyl aminopeptidase
MKKTSENKVPLLLNFLNESPTAWHAVSNCINELKQHGFQEIKEENRWNLKLGGHYFTVRNGSSISAFTLPVSAPHSLQIAASHTDSPAFKLKPNAEFRKENMLMLGVEIYGAPLLSSWLNRDLGIAGRALFLDSKNRSHEELVRIDTAPLIIPQLAIHLDRNVNENGLILNKQEHLSVLAGIEGKERHKLGYLERILKKSFSFKELLAFDLFLYPLDPARLVGEKNELIASYRIDSLVSVHAALTGFLSEKEGAKDRIKMIAFWDNEEIGSHTAQGAGSPFIPQIIERIMLSLKMSREDYFRILSRSLCLSVDLAHAVHPNYSDKHDPQHPLLLNNGIAIKTNAQQRYASDARSCATIIALCKKYKIPFQKYAAHGDIPAGTTIGPIHANLTGMQTVDIGTPQLSMHSSRELTGVTDYLALTELLTKFFQN